MIAVGTTTRLSAVDAEAGIVALFGGSDEAILTRAKIIENFALVTSGTWSELIESSEPLADDKVKLRLKPTAE